MAAIAIDIAPYIQGTTMLFFFSLDLAVLLRPFSLPLTAFPSCNWLPGNANQPGQDGHEDVRLAFSSFPLFPTPKAAGNIGN